MNSMLSKEEFEDWKGIINEKVEELMDQRFQSERITRLEVQRQIN